MTSNPTSNQRCIHFPALPPYEPCDKCEIERLREWQRKACDVLPLIEREAGTSLAARVSELLRGEGSAPEAAPSIWKRMCDEAPVNDGRMIWWDYGNGGMPVLTKAADFGRTDGGYWAEAVPPTRSVHETSRDDVYTRRIERKVAAMVTWLEANQPDVFQRGLWDAIEKAGGGSSVETSGKSEVAEHAHVHAICVAYESGFGHGLANDGVINPYLTAGCEREAYRFGRKAGLERLYRDRLAEKAGG